ncbi:hypothetical protein [Escherichia coli]|uniref:hypothetical protein n=1 Tax=Escherichia coli TaxID=562 RepID=UPI0020324A15|nr:hypothetical protein [Escherichia coli]
MSELTAAHSTIEKAREVTNCPADVDLQDHLRQLVAENVSMKAFGGKLDEMHNDLNGEGTGIQGRAEVACQQVALEAAMEEFDRIETQATDSILHAAEVRGVDKLTDRLQQFLDDGDFVGDEIPVIAGAIYCGKELSEQLREGNA